MNKKFSKYKLEDIANLQKDLRAIKKKTPDVFRFIEDICFHNVLNVAKDTNEHMMISGAKNVYLLISEVMREDITPQMIVDKFQNRGH